MKFKGIVPSHLAVLSVATALSTICLVSGANAGGFALNEQSTTGTGMAYAGVAAGGVLSDMFWNPATLGDVKGLSFESDLTGILPGLNVTTNSLGPLPAQSQGTVGIGGVVPASYSAYRLNQNVIFGLGINAPFGLATAYNQATSYLANIPGSAPPKAIAGGTRVFSLDVNPNVAYQFNNQLTIAVGLQVQYMELTETGFGQPTGAYFGKSKNLGYGYTLGVDWKPMQGTTFGLGYRSGISNGVSGNLAGVLVAPATYMSFAGDIALNTPGMVSFGASQVLDDKWTLRGGATYTNWSTLGTATVTGPAAAVVTASLGSNLLPFNYKDSYSVSTGAE